jgi:prepilin-type N-terminal cleavage/methylation domain-containing protein
MRDEDGFTLIEILIAIFVAAVVFMVMAAAFVVSQQSTDVSTTRLLGSQDAAFTSAHFVKDVQSAKTTAQTGPCPAASGTAVVSMVWTETTIATGTTTYTVDYRYQSATGQLVRFTCGPTTGSDVLASHLKTAPGIQCNPTCATSKAVTMILTEVDGTFRITASRRSA